MYIKGVNLGNWLVLEKWMSPALFEGTTAEDEYYLPRQLSKEVYEARIQIHRSEYITERDFVTIKRMGMNVVRIPVPYFIFGDRAPFIGCVRELDKAFAWAEKYGLQILIDLHTAPMGQNGFDNGGICGVCRWSQIPEEVEFVLTVLERLCERYGKRKGLWGIEVINEPITENAWKLMDVSNRYPAADQKLAAGSGPNSMAFLRQFYIDAYERMRVYLPVEKYVVIHDGFELMAWKDFMREDCYQNVVLDTHLYLMMAEANGCPQTVEGYISYIKENYAKAIEEMEQYFPVICGEWCLFNSLTCGCDTKGGQSVLNGVDGAKTESLTAEQKKDIYQAVAKAQLEAWKKGSGYCYWSYKLLTDTVNEPGWIGWDSWDLGRCVDFGWFKDGGKSMIKNPIFKGFNPDPCVCRKGDDYYAAVSSFEWMPGIPIYHSKDLKNWELYTHVLTEKSDVDLKKLPSAKGIWAPCLTYCEEEELFYVVYGVMNSMNARYFDVDNFVITAKNIRGPWSEPIYLHSSGFDASMFHDDDGNKYVVALEWETREGYEKPGFICIVEYDPVKKEIVGYPKPMWRGGTDRGCIEAPHLTKRGEYYYIMCAEGGTGYNHCVTMGRSKNVWGPYEKDPMNPIVTSSPGESNERKDPDHLKPKYYNPDSILQKSGHGSYVETPQGEVYLMHLCSRPFVPELRCTLGRETAIQKMKWTEDGWLRMADGGNLAQMEVPESSLPEVKMPQIPEFDDFDSGELGNWYYAPRIMPQTFADVKARPGYVRIRGQEARTSLNKVSILARKLTSVYATVTTKMEFTPEIHQHSAGLILYYDNMNYVNLRKYYSETLGQSALSIIQLENGEKEEFLNTRIPVEERPIYLRLNIQGRKSYFEWSYDGTIYTKIGRVFDTTKYSDEYCKYGEFTGAFVGLTCADRMKHSHYADFDFFEYRANEDAPVE